MTNWKNRDSDPPSKYIIPIRDFLGITPYILLTGKERVADADPLTATEKELLSAFRPLKEKDKWRFIGEMNECKRHYASDSEPADTYASKERRAG